NGDLLYGALESINSETGVHWRHADVDHPIAFQPDHIAEIHFPKQQRPAPHSPNTCRVQLSNNDELEGDILVLDREKLLLKTWYAGEITIPRARIQAVTTVPADGAIIFQGPSGAEGWTIGKVVSSLGESGEWKYKN